jgi:hypothetical protein
MRTASDTSSPATGTALDEGSVFALKDGQAGVEQFTPGDHHDVEPLGDLVTTENLSYQSFSSIPQDGATELSGRRNA